MGTAVRTFNRAEAATSIMKAVETRQHEMMALAPKGYDAEYFLSSLRLYFATNPKLLECYPVSVATAMLRVAQTGLELGVSCDILPFEAKGSGSPRAQFNPRTSGLVELMLKAGVRSVNYNVVREGDEFDYCLGAPPSVKHKPALKDRGLVIAAWSAVETKLGSFQITVMTRDEIDGIRRQYSKSWWQKHGSVIPLEDIPWYAAKTVLRQGAKYAPKNPRLAAALRFDADEIEDAEVETIEVGVVPTAAPSAEDVSGEAPTE